MSVRTSCRLVLYFLCGVWAPIAAIAQESFVDRYARPIEAILQEHFAEGNAGMAIGLVDEHGNWVFSAGKLGNGTERRIDGETIFELGSVTKVFTSLLLLDAVRRGEVKLKDPVAKFLPQRVKLPTFVDAEITLEHLAAQESGLPWNPDVQEAILQKDRTKKGLAELRAAYAFLSGHRLTAAPGSGFQYSNVGMALLGHVLERNTGTSDERLVIDRLARPLGMQSTGITLAPDQRLRLVRGHWGDGTPSEPLDFQVMQPAGSLLSTANDLVKFVSAGLGLTDSEITPLVEKSLVVRHIGAPQFGRTAMPWFDEGVYNPPGSEILGHGGGGFGQLAFVGFDTKRRRGVVLLTNQMAVSPYGIGWTLLQGLPLSRENITFWVREIVGLGVRLEADEKSGTPRIATIFPNSPAGAAGLTAGLTILKINGVSVKDKSLAECLALMRGPLGTQVQLELFDSHRKQSRTVELTKQKFVTMTDLTRR